MFYRYQDLPHFNRNTQQTMVNLANGTGRKTQPELLPIIDPIDTSYNTGKGGRQQPDTIKAQSW